MAGHSRPGAHAWPRGPLPPGKGRAAPNKKIRSTNVLLLKSISSGRAKAIISMFSQRQLYAVTMMLSEKKLEETELASYVGWSGTSSLIYYSRIRALNLAEITSDKIVQAINSHKQAEKRYRDFESLKNYVN